MRFRRIAAALLAIAMLAAACRSSDGSDRTPAPGEPSATPARVTLRLAYFGNLTHAPAIVGLARNTFKEDLGPNVTVEPKVFNAGPAEIEALFAGEIDIGYIGPSPTVNGFVKSKTEDVRLIAGANSGGAQLIVRADAGINSPQDFANKKVASPQLGNTQDVALRTWLKSQGLNAREQGGNVTVIPTANADTLTAMQKGDIDAAWVPEPWGTRLVQEAGGKVFLDEKSLWPDGQWDTTNVIVRTDFLEKHPDVVENFLRGHVDAVQWIQANPAEAKAVVNQSIADVNNGKALSQQVIDAAWNNIVPTYDPLASTVQKMANDAAALGFLNEEPDLTKLYALDLLNKVLKSKSLPEVKAS